MHMYTKVAYKIFFSNQKVKGRKLTIFFERAMHASSQLTCITCSSKYTNVTYYSNGNVTLLT